jgi:hypothetical protein
VDAGSLPFDHGNLVKGVSMRNFSILLLCFSLLAPAARAQSLIAEYYALIGPADFYNSSGVRLGDFGAILQQDRANYHRFGRRDEGDGWDPIFSDPAQRSRIPQIWRIAPGSEYIPSWVASGQTRYLRISVYGVGSTAHFMVVAEGAG